MAETLNAIQINDFPETDVVLSSDKLILFDNETFSPILCDVSDLSSFVVLSEAEDQFLKDKMDSVLKMIENAKKYLSRTFITKTDADATYSSINNFNAQFAKLETMKSLENRLAEKASSEDLDEKYNTIKNTINKAKFLLGGSAWDNGGPGRGYKRIALSKAAAKTAE